MNQQFILLFIATFFTASSFCSDNPKKSTIIADSLYYMMGATKYGHVKKYGRYFELPGNLKEIEDRHGERWIVIRKPNQ